MTSTGGVDSTSLEVKQIVGGTQDEEVNIDIFRKRTDPNLARLDYVNRDNLGNNMCIDIDEQCYFGSVNDREVELDPRKMALMKRECKAREGGVIKCCDLTLMNKNYSVGIYEEPIMVKPDPDGRNMEECSEKIKSRCYREGPRSKPLCIQEQCANAGFRLATNQLEICQARLRGKDKIDVPQCPTQGCWGNRFRIPEDLDLAKNEGPREDETLAESLRRKRRNAIRDIKELRETIKAVQKKLGLITKEPVKDVLANVKYPNMKPLVDDKKDLEVGVGESHARGKLGYGKQDADKELKKQKKTDTGGYKKELVSARYEIGTKLPTGEPVPVLDVVPDMVRELDLGDRPFKFVNEFGREKEEVTDRDEIAIDREFASVDSESANLGGLRDGTVLGTEARELLELTGNIEGVRGDGRGGEVIEGYVDFNEVEKLEEQIKNLSIKLAEKIIELRELNEVLVRNGMCKASDMKDEEKVAEPTKKVQQTSVVQPKKKQGGVLGFFQDLISNQGKENYEDFVARDYRGKGICWWFWVLAVVLFMMVGMRGKWRGETNL